MNSGEHTDVFVVALRTKVSYEGCDTWRPKSALFSLLTPEISVVPYFVQSCDNNNEGDKSNQEK